MDFYSRYREENALKVINYECTICEQIWGEDNTFGVIVEDHKTILVEPDESEKHVCRNCIIAIKNYIGNEN